MSNTKIETIKPLLEVEVPQILEPLEPESSKINLNITEIDEKEVKTETTPLRTPQNNNNNNFQMANRRRGNIRMRLGF